MVCETDVCGELAFKRFVGQPHARLAEQMENFLDDLKKCDLLPIGGTIVTSDEPSYLALKLQYPTHLRTYIISGAESTEIAAA